MMDEPGSADQYSPVSTSAGDAGPTDNGRGRRLPLVVWAGLSVAFLLYLAFGTVDARIWRFNQLHVESRSIRRIWQVQAGSLDEISSDWLLQALFYGSLLVFVACVILGMKYLLAAAPDETVDASRDRS